MIACHELSEMLSNFAESLRCLFGRHLKGVILFGSYARGDFDEESDIDVLVLVDIDKGELYKYRTRISQIAEKCDWDCDNLISPLLKNYEEYLEYQGVSGLYKTIMREGVPIYAEGLRQRSS
ncbi:MAG: nucleotidyltransferase domain-containing protein [Clostridiales bacterium]|nr:nucleotidyltransferase domain-containing protein [Clostridiales bacterium]